MKNTWISQQLSEARAAALKIAAIYTLVGGLWIFFSDALAGAIAQRPEILSWLQTLKGWFFVTATAGMLYVLIQRSVLSTRCSEEALHQSQQSLSALMSHLPGMVYRCLNDHDRTMEFASEGCHELTGYRPSDLIGNEKISFGQLIHPDDLEFLQEEIQNALRVRKTFRADYRITTAAGEQKWVREKGRGGFSPDGAMTLEGIITDITERKRSEDEIKRSENKFRSLFENSADAVLLLSGGIFTDCNPAAVEMMRCSSKEQLMSLHPSKLSPERQPDGRPSFEKANEMIAEAYRRKSLRFRWVHRRMDGEDFPVEVLLTAIPMDDRLILHTVWRDVTENVRAEDALKDSEEKYRTLVENASDAILMVDTNRVIVSYNKAFLDLFGFERNEVDGKSIRIIYPSEESFIEFGESAFAMILREGYFRAEVELMRKDGTTLPVEGRYSAIRTVDGSVKAIVATIRDITERTQAERELKEYRDHLEELVEERTRELESAQKALVQKEKLKTLGAISAEVAHEIRNPLMSMGGFAKRLQKKFPETPEVDIILSECQRLEKILDKITKYLKPVQIRPQECPVNSVVAECVGLLSPDLEQERVTWQLDLDAGPPLAYVDPDILTEVVINVIRNTVKVMDKRGILMIRTAVTDQDIRIIFGTPVMPHKLADPDLLLLPFEEGDELTGVSLSYRLLKSMGGLLSFTKENNHIVLIISLRKAPEALSGVASLEE